MKEPRNVYELRLWQILEKGGWKVLRNGFPDIIAVKDNRVAVFEVKSKRGEKLKESQLLCMGFLSRAGVECYRWDKDSGFLPYSEPLLDVRALNKIKEKRKLRKEQHICPVCNGQKGRGALTCHRCENEPIPIKRKDIAKLQEKSIPSDIIPVNYKTV